jgi:hypothetical protein
VLCALKCDLREEQEKDDDDEDDAAAAAATASTGQRMIQYNEGLEMARTIGALRYLGMFAFSVLFSWNGHARSGTWNADDLGSPQNAPPCAIAASTKHSPRQREWRCRLSRRRAATTANAPLCEVPLAIRTHLNTTRPGIIP